MRKDKELAKMQKQLTKEQIEFRNKILRIKPKIKVKKEKPLPLLKVTTRNEYMNNCIYWINEFEAGRYADKERTLLCVKSLRDYCNQIIIENQTPNH